MIHIVTSCTPTIFNASQVCIRLKDYVKVAPYTTIETTS